MKNSRADVIDILTQVQQGKSLAQLLPPLLETTLTQDRALIHKLTLGTLRQWHALLRISEGLLMRPSTDPVLLAGLHVGLYQLLYLSTPAHAAIFTTVEALKQLDRKHFAGLANAVLRKVAKNLAKFSKKVHKNHSLPDWLAKELKHEYSDYYEVLGQAMRQQAPIFLRVNAKFITADAYGDLLTKADIAYEVLPLGFADESCLVLKNRLSIKDLPHFADGWLSVQDRSAMLAGLIIAEALQRLAVSQRLNKPTLRILDACAAPGGKTAHCLEQIFSQQQAGKFHVKQFLAIDSDADRLQQVQENLKRLQLQATTPLSLLAADASTFGGDGLFDLMLLDVPCSATGVIRRHPDIVLLRTADDVAQVCAVQQVILQNLWQQLQVGGYLLYSTCSLLYVENEGQIRQFLSTHSDAVHVPLPLSLPNQIQKQVGVQCLPLAGDDGDGFYYALLHKQ